MYYNVLELKDLLEGKGEKFEKRVLMESETGSICTMYLDKEEILDSHVSDRDGLIYVYEGEAEIHFEAEKFILKKGELIMFKKNDEHKVLALKDTKILLVKI